MHAAPRPPAARSPAKPARPIKNGLVLHRSRNYDGTIRAIYHSKIYPDSIWYAETEKPDDNSAPDPDPYTWDTPPRLINLSNTRPVYSSLTMTSAKFYKKDRMYAKTMDYLRYSRELFGQSQFLKDVMLREIANCELLRKNPHPNICRYYGVDYDTKTKGVTALLFWKYAMTLTEFVTEKHIFDPEKCVQDIRQGIQHIHSLGYAHVDIKPSNIFVDLKARPVRFVVGDFDSMQRQGSKLSYKCGTIGWRPEKADNEDYKVSVEQDWFGLEMVKAWIREKGNGKPMAGKVYPKTSRILKEAKKRVESNENAKAKEKAEIAKEAKAIPKADALKKISAAEKASPRKPAANKKPQEPAKKHPTSPKKKPGAPKKLRAAPQ
ncbi:hypothetical protein ACET3X_008567 [Alternaria dauci]|uniref:Protein kinase domain-containing protein n=1 Tax=Alternaria dauci TaxID=48095 RepID=A0ABR3UB75_9PLEO